MRLLTCVIGIVLVAGLPARVPAAAILIDGFTQGSLSYSATGSNVVNGANESGVDTINGMRASYVDHLFDSGTSTVSLSAGGPLTVTGANHVLALGYGETYVPFGMSATPDLNADLSGTNALKVSFGSLTNLLSIQAQLITHSSNTYGQIDNIGHAILQGAGPGDAMIPYSALTNSFGGGVNLSKVDSIVLSFQTEGTFTVTGVSAVSVPEPAIFSPLAVLAVVRGRRRR